MVAVLSIITGSALLAPAQYAAMALVCVGVIGLGIVEAREDDELRLARQEIGNYKVRQVRPGAGAAHSLLRAGRPGHLRRQQGAGDPERG